MFTVYRDIVKFRCVITQKELVVGRSKFVADLIQEYEVFSPDWEVVRNTKAWLVTWNIKVEINVMFHPMWYGQYVYYSNITLHTWSRKENALCKPRYTGEPNGWSRYSSCSIYWNSISVACHCKHDYRVLTTHANVVCRNYTCICSRCYFTFRMQCQFVNIFSTFCDFTDASGRNICQYIHRCIHYNKT